MQRILTAARHLPCSIQCLTLGKGFGNCGWSMSECLVHEEGAAVPWPHGRSLVG